MICNARTSRAVPARRAFTIVELLVVMVVVLILMSILTAASRIATDTVRDAKSQGDIVAQERTVLSLLRRDLQYVHFLDEDSKVLNNFGRRLSDQRTDGMSASSGKIVGYKPPLSGYFFASSRPVPATASAFDPTNNGTWNFSEGSDNDGFNSSRSGNHVLQFTIIVPGGAPENTLTADVPFQNSPPTSAYPIIGRAAEVSYFLQPNGTTPLGVAKFRLIRRQRLAGLTRDDTPAYSALLAAPPPTGPSAPTPVPTADSSEVMAVNSGTTLLNLNDLTFLANRVVRQPIANFRIGEDVLLTNVTSFEVKFTGPQANGVAWPAPETSTVWPRPFSVGGVPLNTDFPYDNLPFDGNYDTFNQGNNWDQASSNLATPSNPAGQLKPIRITGASIRLRCWNQATKSTRQTTIHVDL